MNRPTQQQLLEILEGAQGHETGWPMWLVFRGRNGMSPRPVDGAIESIFIDNVFKDASHSDYWRVTTDGHAFLLRGYEEDGEPDRLPPGTAFDFTIPVWRFGEALLHAERLARALGIRSQPSTSASWDGLKGRSLRSLWGRRFLSQDRVARQDSGCLYISATADEVTPGLAEILQQLLAPLYTVFDFFDMPLSVIEEELAQMREGRN